MVRGLVYCFFSRLPPPPDLFGLFSLLLLFFARSATASVRSLIWRAIALNSLSLAAALSRRLAVSSSCFSSRATAAVAIFAMY